MLRIRVLTLQEQLYEGEVAQITAPGSAGQFTVLPGHLPFLTTLSKGALMLVDAHKHQEFIEIPSSGTFELDASGIATVLLQS